MQKPIENSLRIICGYFNKNSIPYVIVGGVAVLFFGRARMTTDIDIIFDHHKLDRKHFITAMNNSGIDVNKNDLEALDEKLHAPIFFTETMFRIYLKGVNTDLEQLSIDMGISIEYKGTIIKLDHPSNMIVHKIYFGTEQDREDAVAIFIRNKEILDFNYMNDKANKLGISSDFNQFLDDMKNVNLNK